MYNQLKNKKIRFKLNNKYIYGELKVSYGVFDEYNEPELNRMFVKLYKESKKEFDNYCNLISDYKNLMVYISNPNKLYIYLNHSFKKIFPLEYPDRKKDIQSKFKEIMNNKINNNNYKKEKTNTKSKYLNINEKKIKENFESILRG